MTSLSSSSPRPSGVLAAVLLAIALVTCTMISTGNITSEAAVSLQGDMPRYLMDGVFLRDLLGAGHGWSLDGIVRFAQRYYVQYPALSLGHHPPLLPIVLAPFFLVFGISIETARFVSVGFFLLSVVLLYTFVRQLYERTTAGWACVLFATMPFMAEYGQSVLSEMPATALVLATMNALMRFRRTGRVRDYLLLIALAVTSLSARQLGVFLFPTYVWLLIQDSGWRRLTQPKILVPTAIGGAILAGIAVGTFALSPFNVALIRHLLADGSGHTSTRQILGVIVSQQLNVALLGLSGVGVVVGVASRDRRIGLPLVWILSVLAGVVLVTGPLEPARYSVLAVPAYCVAAASLWVAARNRTARVVVAISLAAATGWQATSALAVTPVGAHGYEEAAAYVATHSQAPTVLYSGVVDTGYFVFFVRKHDPSRRLVVLRSDKLLTTSLMGNLSVEDRITDRQEIYTTLKEFGTRFVVIEDVSSQSKVINWLRDELRGPRFAERQRFAIDTRDHRLRGVDLVVYEYLEATPPASDAEIDVKLPVVNREIRVPLSDFLPAPPRGTDAR